MQGLNQNIFQLLSLRAHWHSLAQNTNRIVGELFIVAMLLSLLFSIYSTWKIYYPLNLLVARMRDTADETNQPPLDEYAFIRG